MTKFILVGGYVHKAKDGGLSFCKEMVSGLGNNRRIKILDCMFARPKESWKNKFNEDKVYLSKFIDNFELELADTDKFTEQIKLSDVIFFRGGDTYMLWNILNTNGDWLKNLENKCVVGTSAGAEVISKYAYNLDTSKIDEYSGLLPIKFIPHWKSDYNSPNINWDDAKEQLDNYKEKIEIITLSEGEFKVFNTDSTK